MPNTNAFTLDEINQILEQLNDHPGARLQYIGSRYVPVFGRKSEDSIEWDNSGTYEPLTIVLYQGNSYTSRQFVPAGIEITNEEYWANTGNYNAQIEQYRQEVEALNKVVAETAEDISQVNVELSKCIRYYNTVSDLISDEYISEGIAITKAYGDDGYGGAKYIVSNTGMENGIDCFACQNGLYARLAESMITPSMIGGMENFEYAITNYPVYLEKDYETDKEINVTSPIAFDGKMRKLTYNGSETFITINIPNTEYKQASGYLKDVVISAPNCPTVIHSLSAYNFTYSGITINDFTEIGITHDAGYECIYTDLNIHGNGKNTIGMSLNSTDYSVKNINLTDCITAIKVNESCSNVVFSEVHGWILSQENFIGSVFMDIYGSGINFFNECNSDTYEIGFNFRNNAYAVFVNPFVYLAYQNIPTSANNAYCFKFSGNTKNISIIGAILVGNYQNQSMLQFADIDAFVGILDIAYYSYMAPPFKYVNSDITKDLNLQNGTTVISGSANVNNLSIIVKTSGSQSALFSLPNYISPKQTLNYALCSQSSNFTGEITPKLLYINENRNVSLSESFDGYVLISCPIQRLSR